MHIKNEIPLSWVCLNCIFPKNISYRDGDVNVVNEDFTAETMHTQGMKLRMLTITVTVIILLWFWSLFWSTQFLRSLNANVLFLKKQIKIYFKSPWVCRFYCVIGHSELASRCPAWPDLESPNAFSACPLLASSAQTSPVITLRLLALAPPPRIAPSLLDEFRNSSKTFELAQSQLSN